MPRVLADVDRLSVPLGEKYADRSTEYGLGVGYAVDVELQELRGGCDSNMRPPPDSDHGSGVQTFIPEVVRANSHMQSPFLRPELYRRSQIPNISSLMQHRPPTPCRVLQQENPEHETELRDFIGRGMRNNGLSGAIEVAGVPLSHCVSVTEGWTCSWDVSHVVVSRTVVVSEAVIEGPPPYQAFRAGN